MNAIVLNTLNLAITEHDLPFTSLSPGYAASSAGLFAIGGETDAGENIDARLVLPCTDQGTLARKSIDGAIYLSVLGPAGSVGNVLVRQQRTDEEGTVVTEEFEYAVQVLTSGVSRAKVGRGIRANRLGFGYANVDGAGFRIKGMEIPVLVSQQRKILP